MRRKETGGFTLIELLIVVVLTVVVLTIAGLPVQQYRMRVNVKRAAAEFASNYEVARTMALRYGRGATIEIDPVYDLYKVKSDTTAANVKFRAGKELNGIDLRSERTLLCFDGRGMPLVTNECEPHNTTVEFHTAYRSDVVRITALGLVRR